MTGPLPLLGFGCGEKLGTSGASVGAESSVEVGADSEEEEEEEEVRLRVRVAKVVSTGALEEEEEETSTGAGALIGFAPGAGEVALTAKMSF